MWIEDFLNCISDTNASELRIEEAFKIKQPHLPSRVYKFREVNKFAIKNLEEDTIWLTSPNEYNDPYDSSISIDMDRLLNDAMKEKFSSSISIPGVEIEKHLSEEDMARVSSAADPISEIFIALLKKDSSLREEQYPDVINAIKKALSQITDGVADKFTLKMQQSLKVCSFSESNESILMWSHYSSNHTGFCIEYNLEGIEYGDLRTRLLFPVIYSSSLFDITKYFKPQMDISEFNALIASIAALYKSNEWAYEHEWRLIIPAGIITDPSSFKMMTPSAIYLGSRMNDGDRQRIVEIALRKGMKIYQAKLSRTEFKIEYDDIALVHSNPTGA